MDRPAAHLGGRGLSRRAQLRLVPADAGSMTSGGLATAFEEWCARRRIHPDSLGAWEAFEACQTFGTPSAVPNIGYVGPDPAAPPPPGPRVAS